MNKATASSFYLSRWLSASFRGPFRAGLQTDPSRDPSRGRADDGTGLRQLCRADGASSGAVERVCVRSDHPAAENRQTWPYSPFWSGGSRPQAAAEVISARSSRKKPRWWLPVCHRWCGWLRTRLARGLIPALCGLLLFCVPGGAARPRLPVMVLFGDSFVAGLAHPARGGGGGGRRRRRRAASRSAGGGVVAELGVGQIRWSVDVIYPELARIYDVPLYPFFL